MGTRVDAVFAEIRGFGAWAGVLALVLISIVVIKLVCVAERSGRPITVKFLGFSINFGVKDTSDTSQGPSSDREPPLSVKQRKRRRRSRKQPVIPNQSSDPKSGH
jgi:hypothetical protein